MNREQDAARKRRSRAAVKPTHCGSCGSALTQPRTSVRRFCSDLCRGRSWAASHATTFIPLGMHYTGHEVFQQAREAANMTRHTAYSVDWGQNDILGEAVLAILEGRNPVEAVRAHRSHEASIQMHKAYGVGDLAITVEGRVGKVKEFND